MAEVAAKEDHSAADAVLEDQEDSIQVQEKCTKQYVQNASKNVKSHLSQLKEDRYIVAIVTRSTRNSRISL